MILAPGNLILLTAPPSSGKTRLILELARKTKRRFLILSPLRALKEELDEVIRENPELQSKIKVKTVESVKSDLKRRVVLESWIVVFDEIHLFFQWGASFRPRLLEEFFAFSELGNCLIAMTATMDNSLIDEFKEFNHFQKIIWFNKGLNQLKTPPIKSISISKYSQGIHLLKTRDFRCKKFLIFVDYKEQVRRLESYFKSRSISCLSCVGGEADEFRKKLKQINPVVIIATKVLGHGVNLPSFDEVWILAKNLSNSDSIQMAGRGGRKGEKFQLFELKSKKGFSLEMIRETWWVKWQIFKYYGAA